jgi:hypothetical protein
MKTKHKQITINIRGNSIAVDRGVRDLIALLNSIPGVETYNSCQCDCSQRGYVQFGGGGALALLPELAAGILRQEQLWRRKCGHNCRGCRSMTVSLEIDGCGICLRWAPWDYGRVLRMVKSLRLTALKAEEKRRLGPDGCGTGLPVSRK